MIGLLFVLGIAACLLARRRRFRRLAIGMAGVAAALFLAIGCGLLPALLLVPLQRPFVAPSNVPWASRNAIVLLGGGSVSVPDGSSLEPSTEAYARILRTAALYRQCREGGRTCQVIVSGGDPQHHGDAEADVYARCLQQLGVPVADLQTETRSRTTWQNAMFVHPLLAGHAPDRIVLVTSAMHLRRALYSFERFGMSALPQRADYAKSAWSVWPLAENFALTDQALHEWIGLAYYRVGHPD